MEACVLISHDLVKVHALLVDTRKQAWEHRRIVGEHRRGRAKHLEHPLERLPVPVKEFAGVIRGIGEACE
jgi:hypothetical protein